MALSLCSDSLCSEPPFGSRRRLPQIPVHSFGEHEYYEELHRHHDDALPEPAAYQQREIGRVVHDGKPQRVQKEAEAQLAGQDAEQAPRRGPALMEST